MEPVPFTHAAARESALIETELEDAGTPINRMDVLIAGTTREADGTLVTRDENFEAIEGLDVERYV